jgi:hypothetical protein
MAPECLHLSRKGLHVSRKSLHAFKKNLHGSRERKEPPWLQKEPPGFQKESLHCSIVSLRGLLSSGASGFLLLGGSVSNFNFDADHGFAFTKWCVYMLIWIRTPTQLLKRTIFFLIKVQIEKSRRVSLYIPGWIPVDAD